MFILKKILLPVNSREMHLKLSFDCGKFLKKMARKFSNSLINCFAKKIVQFVGMPLVGFKPNLNQKKKKNEKRTIVHWVRIGSLFNRPEVSVVICTILLEIKLEG